MHFRFVVLAVALVGAGALTRDAGAQSPLDQPASAASTSGEVTLDTPVTTPLSVGAFRDCDACPEMVIVPAGIFTIGSADSESLRDADEGPQRALGIASFAAGKFEVTFDEWAACAADGGCTSNPTPGDAEWGRGRRPVINVSWDDAMEYVRWLGAETGQPYRLLSEAEWEYAARAGAKTPYAWGTDPTSACKFANLRDMTVARSVDVKCRDGFGLQTAPVGGYRANAFGLYDMQGNVWEWVADCYAPNYEALSADGAAQQQRQCRLRVDRGGSWDYDPEDVRSANRDWFTTTDRISMLGFRVARSMDGSAAPPAPEALPTLQSAPELQPTQ